MLSAEDPIRVVVESGAPSLLSQWGPLVGVVVGAVLGGLAQVVAGTVQRKHDRRREHDRHRRDAYVAYTRALDDFLITSSMVDMAAAEGVNSLDHALDRINRYVATLHELNSATALVEVHGSNAARDLVREIRNVTQAPGAKAQGGPETATPGWSKGVLDEVNALERALTATIRQELGVRD